MSQEDYVSYLNHNTLMIQITRRWSQNLKTHLSNELIRIEGLCLYSEKM